MRIKLRSVVKLALGASLVVAGMAATRGHGSAAAPVVGQDVGLPVGTEAPAAEVQKLDGSRVNLSTYFGKQPVLIEFWATWCPNCKALEPVLAAAKTRYGDKMKFVGVAVTVNQSLARVKAHVEEHKTPLEMLWDGQSKAVEMYDVPATSYIVIVDKTGKIAYGGVGSSQKIDEAIQKVLR